MRRDEEYFFVGFMVGLVVGVVALGFALWVLPV